MDQTTGISEKLDRYRQALTAVTEHHAQMIPSTEHSESYAICDSMHGHYLLMDIERKGQGKGRFIVFHLHLKDGKVWIEQDGIEYGIAEDLLQAGIPAEDIVMAFAVHQPYVLKEAVAA